MADFGGLGWRLAQAGRFYQMRAVVSFPKSIKTSNSDSVCKSYARFSEGVSETDSNSFRFQLQTAISFDPVGQTCPNFFWELVAISGRAPPIFTNFCASLMHFQKFGQKDSFLLSFAVFFVSFSFLIFFFLFFFSLWSPKQTLPFFLFFQHNRSQTFLSTQALLRPNRIKLEIFF